MTARLAAGIVLAALCALPAAASLAELTQPVINALTPIDSLPSSK